MNNQYNRNEPKLYRTQWATWRVRFYDKDRQAYREKVCQTKTEAENLKRAIGRDEDLSFWFPKENEAHQCLQTFKDLAAKWLDHGENVRRISKSCLKNYNSHLSNHIYPIMGSIQLKSLKLDHLENLAKALRTTVPKTKSYLAIRKNRWDENRGEEDSLSLNYQKEILTVACMVTSWAAKRRPKLIPENPFETFQLPQSPEHLYDYWSLDDEDKFLDWLEGGAFYDKETTRYHHRGRDSSRIQLQLRNHEELRDIVLMALRTGMRLGEIGGLRNADVDLAQGFIIVRGSYCRKEGYRKNTTKSKKARRVEINEDAREILMKRRHRPQTDLLFNIEMNCIKFFSRTCRWAGVKEIHFHSLRHTCLTNLANGYGMGKPLPLPKVQQIAGHSDIKTTMRYVHADIINETASLQWSRKDRKVRSEGSHQEVIREAKAELPEKFGTVVPIKKGLKLVSSGKN